MPVRRQHAATFVEVVSPIIQRSQEFYTRNLRGWRPAECIRFEGPLGRRDGFIPFSRPFRTGRQ